MRMKRWVAALLGCTFLVASGTASAAGPQNITINQSWAKLKMATNATGYDRMLDKTNSGGRHAYYRMKIGLDQVRINSYQTAGMKYNFQTFAWLPYLDSKFSKKIVKQLVNPQSFTILNHKIYMVWSLNNNRGYITTFPMNLPAKMKNKFEDFRSAYWYKYNHSNSYIKKGYQSAGADNFFKQVSVSDQMTIGHGQTLTTDGKYLYMLQDTDFTHGSLQGNESIVLYKYDANLKPLKKWSFRLINKYSKYKYNPHTLTMIDGNHFYLGLVGNLKGSYKASYVVFKGTITGNKVSVAPAFRVKNAVGKYLQSLSYDRYSHRLYLVSDDSFVGIDVANKSLRNYSTKIANTRETEGMAFDGTNTYLLYNSSPEIIQARFK
ncbi:hypothetical protein [Sporolactobacillus spathodeae]|uniref:Extracellular protein n=1 Tax=Sporolactobacillus spathodeae TaxID=1465502 RepID=A0ABS2Q8W3_9BACL|nr:hypothetical protein [Sporolactobacillus spathodeae]MBM7657770.1 hypothetical protein [Sporolactobacillus spathodeae]